MISNNTAALHRKRRKNSKLLLIVLPLVTVFIIFPVLVAAWLGFVPGLSNLIGSKYARDLGVRYSADDLKSYNQKSAIKFKDYSKAPIDPLNPTQKNVFGSPKTVNNLSITQEELTALANEVDWSWFPAKDVQVRFSEDMMEMSGYVNSENFYNFANFISSSGNTSNNVTEAIVWANYLAKDMPFYVKASSQITNNQLSFKLVKAEIGRLSIPLGSLGQDLHKGVSGINTGSDNLDIRSASVKPQGLFVSGTYPSEIYVKQ